MKLNALLMHIKVYSNTYEVTKDEETVQPNPGVLSNLCNKDTVSSKGHSYVQNLKLFI